MNAGLPAREDAGQRRRRHLHLGLARSTSTVLQSPRAERLLSITPDVRDAPPEVDVSVARLLIFCSLSWPLMTFDDKTASPVTASVSLRGLYIIYRPPRVQLHRTLSSSVVYPTDS